MSLVLTALMLFPTAPIQDQALSEWDGKVAEAQALTPALVSEYRHLLTLLPDYVLRWVPPPPPVPRVRTYSPQVERWRSLIEAHFDSADIPWAMRVMNCESMGDPSAQNPTSTADGLFQFLDGTWAETPYAHLSKFDPEANIAAAAWLLRDSPWGGPQHWVCK